MKRRKNKESEFKKAFQHTKKCAPHFTFPSMSERVFADFRHKLPVPSPDTYWKEGATS